MTIVGAMKNAFHDLETKGDALIVQLEEREHEVADAAVTSAATPTSEAKTA